jgi:hypothetical protein
MYILLSMDAICKLNYFALSNAAFTEIVFRKRVRISKTTHTFSIGIVKGRLAVMEDVFIKDILIQPPLTY